MINRLLRQLSFSFSLIYLLCTSNILNAQNMTSIPGPGNDICAGSQFIAPVLVDSIVQVDSLFLTIRYPKGTLTYGSDRLRNQQLRDNGFFTVTSPNDSTVTIKWIATTPQTIIGTTTLLELIFITGKEEGNISFVSSQSWFRNSTGEIPTVFSGAEITLFPLLSVIIEEIDATCPDACDANIAAFVRGGLKPYTFHWQGVLSIFDSVVAGACGGINNLKITDANGCILDTNFTVSVLDASEVELLTDPDTVYIQNPVIQFSFSGDQSVVDWLWDFGDGSQGSREQAPKHVYSSASNPEIENYNAVLHIVNESGCSDTISFTIPISEADLFIPNVFTPGGNDQINNYFKITKEEEGQKIPIDSEFIRMELIVLDRWGRKVYDNNNYKNDWDGDNLPEGTYYYRLNTFGYFRDESFKGSVTILR